MRKLIFIPSVLFILLCISCQTEGTVKIPDVSDKDPQFSFVRFDKKLWEIDTNSVENGMEQLFREYPAFSDLYFNRILIFDDPDKVSGIRGFLTDERITSLYDTTQLILGNLSDIQDDFYSAFQFFQYYFPDRDVPDIYTFLSEYAYQTFIFSDENGKDAIGVGLDMFLGAEYPYSQLNPNNPSFSGYLTRSFNKDHIVKKSLETLIQDILGAPNGNTLLDHMVHNGKKLYILDQLMPQVSDTIIMEYTPTQLEWCMQNEIEMWAYLFDQDLFYTNDFKKINKLINPSPHSQGMPPAAPGRTANYLGWQIVKAYMKRFPQTSVQQLIENRNAQSFLERSKFKPRRH